MILSEYWKIIDQLPIFYLKLGRTIVRILLFGIRLGSKHQVTTKTLGRNALLLLFRHAVQANVFNSPQQSISINTFIDHRTERNKSVDYIFAAVRTVADKYSLFSKSLCNPKRAVLHPIKIQLPKVSVLLSYAAMFKKTAFTSFPSKEKRSANAEILYD